MDQEREEAVTQTIEPEAKDLSRRSFMKWSSVLVGAAATSGLVACASSTDTPIGDTESEPVAGILEGGEWKNGACWLLCGGNCLNKVYVKDGVVIQQKTETAGEDSFDFVQQRACARGRALRHLVFGADRIKYPLKRKNWQPGGVDFHGELRGIDEWERISWEEALEMTASEIKRISDTYGGKAIYMDGRDSPRSMLAYKGFTAKWGPRSWGGTWLTTPMIFGRYEGSPPCLTLPDRYEYYNSKLIILWGHNPVWSCQSNAIRNFQAAKAEGARIIVVDPIYHDSAKVLDAEFIPVRPAEDVPLLLAIAYEMLANNWHDQEFLDTYCVGFDADHMPEGAPPESNFKDYVLGTYDGVPKTPEWATELCGTPVDMIRSLAEAMGTVKPMAFTSARAPARVSNGSEFSQAFLTVGLMTGNIGKPGAAVGHVGSGNFGSGNNGPKLVNAGSAGIEAIKNPVTPYTADIDPLDAETDYYAICNTDQWRSVLNKKIIRGVQGETDLDIRMIASMNKADNFNCCPDINVGIEAHRSVEFVLASPIVMDTRALYADIILPASTPWEQGNVSVLVKGNREVVLACEKVVEPIFETRPDSVLEGDIGIALGLDPKLMHPMSEEQQYFNILAGSTVIAADGKTKEPLITITAEDVPDGVECEPQTGKVTLQKFLDDGLYRVERSRGDNYGFLPYKDFVDDPVANPVDTPSGKIEIYCQRLAERTTAYGYTVKEPIAKYGHFKEGWMDTYADWDNKVKGDYPLMGLSLHGYRTVHSACDNVPPLREAFPYHLRINPVDAAERGIKTDDIVLITSRWGKSLRRAELTERIMAGVVMVEECALANVDPETGIDDAGCFNVLTGPIMSDCGVAAWNSTNVQIEKWDGDFVDDSLKPQRIVEG